MIAPPTSWAQGSNLAPAVSLTTPAHGATFTAPAAVTMGATASDGDGSIARVEFYRDATLVGTDTSAPYTATLSSLPAGSYTLTATAVDNRGASPTSAPAVISVAASAPRPPCHGADRDQGGHLRRRRQQRPVNYGGATTLYVRRSSTAGNVLESYLLYKLRPGRGQARAAAPVAEAHRREFDPRWSAGVRGVQRRLDGCRLHLQHPAGQRPTPTATFSVTGTTAAVVDIDVTAYVQAASAKGWTRVAFALKGAANTSAAVSFPSREASGGTPVLVVQ